MEIKTGGDGGIVPSQADKTLYKKLFRHDWTGQCWNCDKLIPEEDQCPYGVCRDCDVVIECYVCGTKRSIGDMLISSKRGPWVMDKEGHQIACKDTSFHCRKTCPDYDKWHSDSDIDKWVLQCLRQTKKACEEKKTVVIQKTTKPGVSKNGYVVADDSKTLASWIEEYVAAGAKRQDTTHIVESEILNGKLVKLYDRSPNEPTLDVLLEGHLEATNFRLRPDLKCWTSEYSTRYGWGGCVTKSCLKWAATGAIPHTPMRA